MEHHIENLTALLAFVAADKGVTLAPVEVIQLPHPNAVFILLKPPVPSVASAAAQRKDDMNPLRKELLDCCHRRRVQTFRSDIAVRAHR